MVPMKTSEAEACLGRQLAMKAGSDVAADIECGVDTRLGARDSAQG